MSADAQGQRQPQPNGNGKRKLRHGERLEPPRAVNGYNPRAPRSNLLPIRNAARAEQGAQLYSRALQLMMRRLAEAEAVEDLVDQELARKKRGWRYRVTMLRAAVGLTATELRTYFAELGDRYGQPRRTIEDVNVRDLTRVRLVIPAAEGAADGLGWPEAKSGEVADAAGGGNGSDARH